MQNRIISALKEKNIPFTTINGGRYVVKGFYKCGEVVLTPIPNSESFDVEGRLGFTDRILNFDDLVHLNYGWWINSKTGNSCWELPNAYWEPELKRLGLI